MKSIINKRALILLTATGFLIGIGHFTTLTAQRYLSGIIWPEPKVITPGTNNSAPSDAVVLFDGNSFDAWKGAEKWTSDEDGGFTVKGAIQTKKGFGDCQLHLEYAAPKKVRGNGQGRGNNGIGFMGGRYEVQVLDSFKNKTYFEGQCVSIYNQYPPMVNACRPPGEWQTVDIIFTAPRFEKDGALKSPAYMTVLHNGVLVHNHAKLHGNTPFNRKPKYTKHAEKLPLTLMYHGNPVRFRNIWIREYKELVGKRQEG